MPDIAWPTVRIRRTAKGTRVRWTPALLTACAEAREQGACNHDIAAHYNVPVTSVETNVPGALRQRTLARLAAMEAADALAEARRPTPPDRRRLSCGCGPGHRCERAKALAEAYQALPSGSAEWAVERQKYLRHVSGGEETNDD